ncbi:MAG: threonylcarbamoyl-AMP synthase [Lachnospiraceae bacterium]|nr:threonylcarbamoyl-AMP synthase [Lachnospiraceae bacterium]
MKETIWWKIGDPPGQDAILKQAGEILQNGGLVAFPTETVYGLGGDAFNPASSKRIYAAKGRPSDNPLIVHICRLSDLEKTAVSIPKDAYRLAEAFWPGPLTMILKKTAALPSETTGGLDTVAVRFPSHPLAQALIDAAGGFVAAPSANTSGRPSPTVGKYVYEDLCGRIDMLIDDGQVGLGLESTIVDLTEDHPMILRPGFITETMLRSVLGDVSLDPALLEKQKAPDLDPQKTQDQADLKSGMPAHSAHTHTGPKAPGMKYKHYAPKGEVIIFEGDEEKVSERLLYELQKDQKNGTRSGVILSERMLERLQRGKKETLADSVKCLGSSDDTQAMAHMLFRFLREFDDEGIQRIYVRAVAQEGLGLAVMNRLKKAAGGRIISL